MYSSNANVDQPGSTQLPQIHLFVLTPMLYISPCSMKSVLTFIDTVNSA